MNEIEQPQFSCPFRNPRQKIYGLGYNLLLFVYEKTDDPTKKAARLNFLSCSFIHKQRTADYQMTKTIRQMIETTPTLKTLLPTSMTGTFLQTKSR